MHSLYILYNFTRASCGSGGGGGGGSRGGGDDGGGGDGGDDGRAAAVARETTSRGSCISLVEELPDVSLALPIYNLF